MANYEEHNFYCIKCGQKGIPIQRKVGHQHSRLHFKKLYCPYCKVKINHVECRNYEETKDFQQKFKEGFYFPYIETSIKESNG